MNLKITKAANGQTYFFDKNGKRLTTKEGMRRLNISKTKKQNSIKEKERRRKISEGLKRYHAKKKSSRGPKPSPKRSGGRPGRPKKRAKKTPKNYSVERKRSKVKSFPKKDEPTKFFFSDKKKFVLNEPIDVLSESDAIERIRQFFDSLRPLFISFFKRTLNKNSQKNKIKSRSGDDRRIDVGYEILLEFQSKNEPSDITPVITTAYKDGALITRAKTSNETYKKFLDGKLDIILGHILDAFALDPVNSYLANEWLSRFEFFGFEAEIMLL